MPSGGAGILHSPLIFNGLVGREVGKYPPTVYFYCGNEA